MLFRCQQVRIVRGCRREMPPEFFLSVESSLFTLYHIAKVAYLITAAKQIFGMLIIIHLLRFFFYASVQKSMHVCTVGQTKNETPLFISIKIIIEK